MNRAYHLCQYTITDCFYYENESRIFGIKKCNINRYRANQQNSSMLPKGITDLDH